MPDQHKNFAASLVATAPSPASSGTSLVVTGGEGALFPAVPFNATIWPAGVQPTAANAEVARVTGRATDTLTIVRAQEGSGARTVVVGDQIAATVTAKTLTDAEDVTVSTIAATGSTETVDVTVAGTHDLTLDANCTLTLTGAVSGKRAELTLLLRQDGTGSRLVTWPGAVTWLSGNAPVLKTAAAAVDTIVLYTVDGGTVWYGAQAAAKASGQMLVHTAITADVSISGTSGAPTTVITGAATVFTNNQVRVDVYTCALFSGTQTVVLELFRDSTSLGRICQNSANIASVVSASVLDTPSAGSHQYILKGWITGGTAAILAATSPFTPAFVRVAVA